MLLVNTTLTSHFCALHISMVILCIIMLGITKPLDTVLGGNSIQWVQRYINILIKCTDNGGQMATWEQFGDTN